jgi:hypothetical protein
MKTLSKDIPHHFATAFIALVVFLVCMVMSENREQLIIIFLVFWSGSTLLNTLHAILTHVLRSTFGRFAAEETDLHHYKKVSTASQASDYDSFFYDTMEVPLKSPPRTKRYSMDTTQESLKIPPGMKRYSVDTTSVTSSKKKQTTRSPLQSPTFGTPKKLARLAAIQRAKLVMQDDKQKVDAMKRKKEREEGYKRAK